jgi:hypothetical protein
MMRMASSFLKQVLYKYVPTPVRREIKRRLYGYPAICPQIYKWAKQNPQHAEIIQEYWQTHRGRRKAPKSISSLEIPKAFLDHLDYPIYEKTLFCIKNPTIRGADGVLFLPDGLVSQQTGWALEHIIETQAYKGKLHVPTCSKRGNYSTLIYYWGATYYHWFNDVLSTLHESLELMPSDTIFLLPSAAYAKNAEKFHIKSLLSLGISRDRMVEFDGNEAWTLENLWWQPPAVHPDDQTPDALQWIGKRISESIPVLDSEKPGRIYVSRREPVTRVICNEQEFVRDLERKGFRVCVLENLPFEEQVRLFRNAELVVAPHGAGLTNLIFSKPGTPVVEIHAKGYERRHYWDLCEELGHEYRFYLGEAEFPGRRGEPDIWVDAANLLKAL